MHGAFVVVPIVALLAAMALLLAGCPKRPAKDSGPPPENLLEIPPLGTQFEYVGEPVNWNFAPHPRIIARPEGIEYLRQNPDCELYQTLLSAANGSRALMSADPNYREAVAPLACAWGFVLTGDPDFLDAVRGSLDWLLNFPPLVRAPEGSNIPFLYQALSLGGVYDLLYDDLTETERAEIEKVLRETVFHTLAYKVTKYDPDINFWELDPDTNYFVTFHSSAGLAAILLAGVEPDAEALAEHCWKRIQESMQAFADENGWREGLTYLDFCWGQFACYFLLALERNSDLRPFDHPWFAASIPWAEWGALPDRQTIACFGDNEPENYSVGSWLYRVGVLLRDHRYIDEAMKTGEAISAGDAPEEMRHLALDLPLFEAMALGRGRMEYNLSIAAPEPAVTRDFPGIEWAVMRSGPSDPAWNREDDFYCALKSGVAGYDHNHLDQGSLILAAYSEVLLSDPGRGGPDIIRRDPYLNCLFEAGLGHNTLVVGDGCYMDLELFPDNPKYFARPGRITSADQTDEYVQYTTDNSGLYPTEPLVKYQRTFVYVLPGIIDGAELGALVIADRVEFSEGMEHSFLFHTPGTVETAATGVAKLINGGARLDYTGFCTVPTIDRTQRQETTWAIRDSTCYWRSTDSPQRASDWVHVLVPARIGQPGTPAPHITMFGFGVRVTWPDYELTLMVKPETGWVAAQLPQ